MVASLSDNLNVSEGRGKEQVLISNGQNSKNIGAVGAVGGVGVIDSVFERFVDFLDSFFELNKNKTSVRTEILAGVTTFITMAYIIFVNPSILRMAGINSGHALGDMANKYTISNDPLVASVFTATCLSSAIGTLVMGIFANIPFALAPGMGLNAFFTFGVCLGLGYSWQQALGAVFISGIVFIVITITSLQKKIIDSIPYNLKLAISGGIGLFVALIGLKSGKLIVANPATLVSIGNFSDKSTLLTLFGIIVTAVLMSRKISGAILIGILVTTVVGIPLGITKTIPINQLISLPPSVAPTFFALDLPGMLNVGG
ncbi:MAG: NCS2 family permease, partial [Oligoflexia bacterium]|nr:NCS2 family permease [Oligoflexia bacterium]